MLCPRVLGIKSEGAGPGGSQYVGSQNITLNNDQDEEIGCYNSEDSDSKYRAMVSPDFQHGFIMGRMDRSEAGVL